MESSWKYLGEPGRERKKVGGGRRKRRHVGGVTTTGTDQQCVTRYPSHISLQYEVVGDVCSAGATQSCAPSGVKAPSVFTYIRRPNQSPSSTGPEAMSGGPHDDRKVARRGSACWGPRDIEEGPRKGVPTSKLRKPQLL